MFEFIAYEFGKRALIGGLVVAVACAILGVFLVLQRLSLIADGLGHVSFGGIAYGFFAGIYPLFGAIGAVILGALGIYGLKRIRVFSDAAIGMIASGGLALGIVLVSLTQSVPADLYGYLFGSILGITVSDMYLAAALSVFVIAVFVALWKEWISITVDKEFAKISGIPVEMFEVLFILLTGLTVVIATKIVGVLLVSSLMIIPASASIQLKLPFKKTVLVSCILAILAVLVGLQISFLYNISAGGAIVLVAITFFVIIASLVKYMPRTKHKTAIGKWKCKEGECGIQTAKY